MSKVTFRVENYENFGKCIVMSNGLQEAFITVDVGPRIIKYNILGEKNIMMNDINRSIVHEEKEIQEFFGKGSSWIIYGGHRFWVSPESLPETYYPDNEKVDYTINESESTLTVVPPKQKGTGWQEKMIIKMCETDTKMNVTHILENLSGTDKGGSIWALSVLAPGGISLFPQSKNETKLLANRTMMIWPYNDMEDERFYIDNDYIGLKQDVNATKAFKIGINNTSGKAVYYNNDCVFKKEYVTKHDTAIYPDNGVSLEVYSCADFLELETLGEYKVLKNGEKLTHIENWSLTKDIIEGDTKVQIQALKKHLK